VDASGFQGWVHSPEDEDRYVDPFSKSERLRLDTEAIRYNAAKRSLAKLYLNFMWGKLTERNDRSMRKIITEPKDLYGLVATPGVEVMNHAFASDEAVYIC
jgi:hypothetical protein